MRSLVVCSALTLLGCVSFPSARLDVTAGVREELKAPVVCGPMGFRKTPLQSRWGEYVRVTVRSPGVLRGSAFVHANGEAGETRSWSTEQGELVVEARFENLDPDQRYLLVREQPIDITLTGLEGACEGAVFTVEQGELVPDIDERAWVAELERRGGPELLARREAVRLAAEARRQAHYAAWEARQQIEVSAEVVAMQDTLRAAHYAQWEAQRNPQPAEWGAFPETLAHFEAPAPLVEPVVAIAANEACTVHREALPGAARAQVPESAMDVTAIVQGDSRGCASCAVAPVAAQVEVSGGCASCEVVSGAAQPDVAVAAVAAQPGSAGGCASCAVVASGAAQLDVAVAPVATQPVSAGGCASCAVPAGATVEVAARADVTIETTASAQLASEWDLPEQARLREVTVSTEQHTLASSPAEWAPVPVSTVVAVEPEEVATVDFVLPALFGFLLQATAPVVVAAPPPPQRVVRAVPITPR